MVVNSGRGLPGRLSAPAWWWLLILALVPLAWSCAAQAGPSVVTSIGPLHSLSAAVMGEHGTPRQIVRGYGSPHAYQMRPSDAAALHEAELIVWVGPALETARRLAQNRVMGSPPVSESAVRVREATHDDCAAIAEIYNEAIRSGRATMDTELVGAADRVYAVSRDGLTVVFRAGDRFEVLATNQLEDVFNATPAIVGDTLILRGDRYLYRIGEE